MSAADQNAAYECIFNGMKSAYMQQQLQGNTDEQSANQSGSSATRSLLDCDSASDEERASADDILTCELNGYRMSKCEPIASDPLEYWKAHEQLYPHVAMQAAKLLSVPATSVPCERLFSAGGIVVDRRRASLRPDNVQQLLCLHSWLE